MGKYKFFHKHIISRQTEKVIVLKIYIAEKESVGKELAKCVFGEGANVTSSRTHKRCGDTVVAWLQGHVLALYEPEDYDERFAKWSWDTILYVPEKWKFKEIPRTKYIVDNLRVLLKEAKEVVNAGDRGGVRP